ncbi:MAG: ORF6N domain-containing protein [Clostridia bacterium]|nr:ORF6N domain-containing protein [Clostridia bacterium]
MSNESTTEFIEESSDIVKYEVDNIKDLIYYIRGKQVMLDSDVAMLYHYETKNINKAMKRNIERFPEDFCFQLTEKEVKNLRFQIGTLNKKINNGEVTRKYLPYVYTEQGISMLSGVLKNNTAIKISINIMRAFIEMRKFISTNAQVFERLTSVEYKLLEHDNKFNQVFNELQKNKKEEFKQKIFFKGQIWDSYELIIDIIKKAKEKIVIIDNYLDDTILKMIQKKNKNVEVILLTSQNCSLTKLDIRKFNEQYPVLKIARTNKFHDRFIIIDNKELYHCGASFKDLGKKCFAINKIEEERIIKDIMKLVI